LSPIGGGNISPWRRSLGDLEYGAGGGCRPHSANLLIEGWRANGRSQVVAAVYVPPYISAGAVTDPPAGTAMRA